MVLSTRPRTGRSQVRDRVGAALRVIASPHVRLTGENGAGPEAHPVWRYKRSSVPKGGHGDARGDFASRPGHGAADGR